MVSLFLEETLENWWEYDRRKESTSSLPWFSKKCRWDWDWEEEGEEFKTTSSDHINFLLREFEITILGFLGAAGQLFSGGILSSSLVGVLQSSSSSSSSSEEASRIFFFFSSSSLETRTELIICSLDMGVVVVAVRKLEERERERGKRLKHTHPHKCMWERERDEK